MKKLYQQPNTFGQKNKEKCPAPITDDDDSQQPLDEKGKRKLEQGIANYKYFFGEDSDVDLNQYIQNNMGKSFSCKDFRTYAANFYFIKALLKETKNRNPVTQKIAKKKILLAHQMELKY